MSGRGSNPRYTPQNISMTGMPTNYPQYPNVATYPVAGANWGANAQVPNSGRGGRYASPQYYPNQQYQQYNQQMYSQGMYQPQPGRTGYNAQMNNLPYNQPMKTGGGGRGGGRGNPRGGGRGGGRGSPRGGGRGAAPGSGGGARRNQWIGAQRTGSKFTASKRTNALKQMGHMNFMNTMELNKIRNDKDALKLEADLKIQEAQMKRQQQLRADQLKLDQTKMREQIRREEEQRLRALEGKRKDQEKKKLEKERAVMEARFKKEEEQRNREAEDMRRELELYKQQLEQAKMAVEQAKAVSQIQAGALMNDPTGDREKHVWEISPADVEITKELGKGAFGVVYSGRLHGKSVAIKKLFMQDTEEDLILDFKNEVQVMNHLRHPNILLLMGACFDRGDMMIITEMMPGGSVDDLIHKPKSGRKLTFAQRMKIARDTALGMNWLHNLSPPFLHLDLKSANLLVNVPIASETNMDFVVKVADFGLTQMKTKSAEGMVGSPFYMAPEMLLEKEYDEKVDIYSFSIVMWELFTCQEPYKDMFSELEELIEAITIDLVRPELPADTPPALKKLLESCWQDDPKKRPSFGDIVDNRSLEKIIIEHEIKDAKGAGLWKHQFVDKFYVFWDEFWKGFCMEFNVLFSDNDVKAKIFKELVIDKSTDRVTMQSFHKCLAFFGPLKDGSSFLDRVDGIAAKAWFFGPMATADSETLLKSSKKRGTFLVRFSSRNVGCYTISVYIKGGKVKHSRINRTSSGQFSLNGKSYKSLNEVLAAGQKLLGLKNVCPGSPFQNIYMPSSGSAEYMYGSFT